MNCRTELMEKRQVMVFGSPSASRANLSGIGLMVEGIRLELYSVSWKISLKFVLNAMFCLVNIAKNTRVIQGLRSKLNLAISIPKAAKAGGLDCFYFAQLQRAVPAAPIYIVVNPMITESA